MRANNFSVDTPMSIFGNETCMQTTSSFYAPHTDNTKHETGLTFVSLHASSPCPSHLSAYLSAVTCLLWDGMLKQHFGPRPDVTTYSACRSTP
jgi:hypothetical protein